MNVQSFFFPTNTASHNRTHVSITPTCSHAASSMFMTSHLRSCSVQVEFALHLFCTVVVFALPALVCFLAKCAARLALCDRVDVFAYLFHCCFALSNTRCRTILPGVTYYPVPYYYPTQTASDTVPY